MTDATLRVHIAAGVIVILGGAVAVRATKGDRLHRRNGVLLR
jgi:uncharacterized membrane protein